MKNVVHPFIVLIAFTDINQCSNAMILNEVDLFLMNCAKSSKVLEENLHSGGKEIFKIFLFSSTNSKTTKESSENILLWLWSDHGNNTKIDLQSITAENRNRSPMQTMWSKQTACREFNLLYVAALRAAGIPARHCSVGYWYQRDSYHFFTEYWDKELQQWVAVDATDDQLLKSEPPKDRVARGRWNSLVYYAHPAVASETDIYGKCLWSECVNITSHLTEVFSLDVRFPGMKGEATVSTYVWNMGTWRLIHTTRNIEDVDGVCSGKVELGKTKRMDRPVMITATNGETLYWTLATLTGEEQIVRLQDVEKSGGLVWSGGKMGEQ
ncbi:MAG: transglutaminase-like domain-containing protein [Luteolibacter sp.]